MNVSIVAKREGQGGVARANIEIVFAQVINFLGDVIVEQLR